MEWSESGLTELLAKKFAPPAWAFFPQARNGTGFTRMPRTCDALAVSLWPSRGIEIHGFEIKVNRSDWSRELADPEKSIEWQSRCHHWWIVAPSDVVPLPELPANWGLIEPATNGRGLRYCKAAPKLQPKELGISFVAALCRDVFERYTPKSGLKTLLAAEYSRGKIEGEGKAQHEGKRAIHDLAELRENVKAFERASGVTISHWKSENENLGAAVAAVLRCGRGQVRSYLENQERCIRECLDAMAAGPKIAAKEVE